VNYEQLWAPWRLEYIKRDPAAKQRELEESARLNLRPGGDRGCFMCRAVADNDDRKHLIVYRGPTTFVILNRFPYNNGHLLIAPYDHHGRLDELEREVNSEAVEMLSRLVQVLEREIKAQGFNIGLNLGAIAGAGVPGHLHWHVLPRWQGDTNFMPTIAGTRVISQSLDELYEIVHSALHAPAGGAPS
jgi:ATP adenylyltransferase